MPHKNRPGEFDRLVREALLDLYKRVFGGLPGTAGPNDPRAHPEE